MGNGISIPMIYLYSYTYLKTPKQDTVSGSNELRGTFTINCENYNYLSIESLSNNVDIICQKTDGSTVTVTYNSIIDITEYVSISFQPSVSTSISAAYQSSTSAAQSVTLTNVLIY